MRTIMVITVMALLGTVILPYTYAQNDDPSGDGGCGSSDQLDADLLLQQAVALENAARYAVLKDMTDLDEQLAEPLSENITFGEEHVGSTISQGIEVGEESSYQTSAVDITRDVIQVAEGATPTLNVFAHLGERSKHRDYWTMWAEAKLLGCSAAIGTSEVVSMEDVWGHTDVWQGVLELPLNAITSDVEGIEVQLRAIVCRYGWYTGDFKGCEPAEVIGFIDVEIVNL